MVRVKDLGKRNHFFSVLAQIWMFFLLIMGQNGSVRPPDTRISSKTLKKIFYFLEVC